MAMLRLAGTFRIFSTEPGGGAQVRLNGIDAVETHYSPRRWPA